MSVKKRSDQKKRIKKKAAFEPGKLKGLPPKTSHIYTLNERKEKAPLYMALLS